MIPVLGRHRLQYAINICFVLCGPERDPRRSWTCRIWKVFLKSLLYLAETIGWRMFIYLGGAGAYELIGGRRVRASALLAAALGWIAVTFTLLWLARGGGAVAVILVFLYLAALVWLARTVFRSVGKPDMDIR